MPIEQIINQRDGLELTAEVAGNPRDKRAGVKRWMRLKQRLLCTGAGSTLTSGFGAAISIEVRWELSLHETTPVAQSGWH